MREDLGRMLQGTLFEWLGMELLCAEKDIVQITLPVDHRTVQPLGFLHGGASLAVAETAASLGAWLNIDTTSYYAVGIEINGNHLKSVSSGSILAVATPLHRGKSTHVWEVHIKDEFGTLIAVSRCTLAIVKRTTSDN